MSRLFSFCVLTFLGVGMATAAPAIKYLTWDEVDSVKAVPGKPAEAVVSVRVVSGYHVQSNPASNAQLIPTTLEIEPTSDIKPGKVVYPKGKPYRLQGSPNEISAYEGRILLKVPLTVGKNAKPGPTVLHAKLRYQACNEKNCFFPTTGTLDIPVDIAPLFEKR